MAESVTPSMLDRLPQCGSGHVCCDDPSGEQQHEHPHRREPTRCSACRDRVGVVRDTSGDPAWQDPPADHGLCTDCYEWRYDRGLERFGFFRACAASGYWACRHDHHATEMWLA